MTTPATFGSEREAIEAALQALDVDQATFHTIGKYELSEGIYYARNLIREHLQQVKAGEDRRAWCPKCRKEPFGLIIGTDHFARCCECGGLVEWPEIVTPPPATPQGWVACSTPPQLEAEYLVHLRIGQMELCRFYYGGWHRWCEELQEYAPIDFMGSFSPTHWMPLPNPPEHKP